MEVLQTEERVVTSQMSEKGLPSISGMELSLDSVRDTVRSKTSDEE